MASWELPPKPDWDDNNPLRKAGFVHESEVIELFGCSVSSWKKYHRNRIPGRTTNVGRIYHIQHLIDWWPDDKGETGQHDSRRMGS